jgi:hypothetical protein
MTVMMIVGCLNDEELLTVGNGKTLTAVAIAHDYYYKHGRKVYTNFKTTFSKKITPLEMVDLFYDDKISPGSLIILDEIQQWLEGTRRTTDEGKNLIEMLRQRRKLGIDIIGTLQRYKDLNNRVRQITDRVLFVQKHHRVFFNGEFYYPLCQIDNCKKHHYIHTISAEPNDGRYVCLFDVDKYKNFYDTNEKIDFSYKNLKRDKEFKDLKDSVRMEKLKREWAKMSIER